MRRFGKLVIMTDKEHYCLTTQLDMAEGYKDVAVADLHIAEAARDDAIVQLHRMQETRRAERKRAFTAGKWHAAGGYSHTLPKVKEQLCHATESLAHCINLLVAWRPLVASLETTPGQFVDHQFDTKVSVTRELNGIAGKVSFDMSDPDAETGFVVVGSREWKKRYGYMTREEFESMYQGHWDAAEKVTP